MHFTDTELRVIVKDPDGNRYAIPESLVEDFKIMSEAIQLVEWGSNEWFENRDALSSEFGSFIKG